ncbi:3-ketoacyl-ACP reductase [Actinobacillus pleuropneumoniae]|nr:3-ketoacyl-ACP reductase [Actinobacillus pleuropneumoniae]
MRMKEDDWFDIIQTNLTSVYRLSKAVLRPMMKKGGRIVTIGSVVGSMGNPGQTNYCAAKAGLVGFSKSLAKEVASRGITVNVVAPGFIATDMTDELNEDQKQAILSQIPVGQLGSAQDIAKAVAFLASDDAKYITGRNYPRKRWFIYELTATSGLFLTELYFSVKFGFTIFSGLLFLFIFVIC